MTLLELQETYRLIGRIGSGSGGEIILAEHKRLKRKVILKRILNPAKSDAENRREAEILKKLKHESLPTVYDFVTVDGDLYTIMDFIDGESLESKIKKRDRFSLSEIRNWGIQIANALSVIHSNHPKILHLDVKPGNIMIRENGKAVLIDFNVSLDGSAVSRMGYSENFCAPEQKEIIEFSRRHRTMPDLSRLSEETDIYSLGAVLYYLAGGKHYDQNHPLWDQISQRYVPEFTEILRKALAADPKERYRSAAAMKADLKGMEEASRQMTEWKKKTRIRNWICYGIMCICICLFGFSIHLMRGEGQEQYNQVVDQMSTQRADGNYDNIEDLFNEARSMQPDQLRAYYEKAAALHEQSKYKEAADFIQGTILSNNRLNRPENGMENTYYLLADSQYQQKLYKESVDTYDELFEMEKLQPVFYRDYAISLGYNRQFEKANSILEEAAARGLDNASLTYANAEISYARKEILQALGLMNEALKELDDDSVRMHAYAKIAEWNLEARQFEAARDALLQARVDLPANLQPVILETLVQTDSKLAEQTGDSKYQKEAIGAIQEIINNGWAVYSDYNNMAVFYEKLGQLDEAEKTVAEIEKKYGEDYNIWKRRAFLEIDRQQKKANADRNYTRFEDYYKKAKKAYGDEAGDVEMALLESLREDLQKGGWL